MSQLKYVLLFYDEIGLSKDSLYIFVTPNDLLQLIEKRI